MRTLRAALAAARWIFDFSRIIWITRIVASFFLCTTMVFGASVMTVAMHFPEDSLTPLWVELRTSPLSAYAHWSAAATVDDDDDEFWIACIADPDCVDRICSIDVEREQMEAAVVDRFAGAPLAPP